MRPLCTPLVVPNARATCFAQPSPPSVRTHESGAISLAGAKGAVLVVLHGDRSAGVAAVPLLLPSTSSALAAPACAPSSAPMPAPTSTPSPPSTPATPAAPTPPLLPVAPGITRPCTLGSGRRCPRSTCVSLGVRFNAVVRQLLLQPANVALRRICPAALERYRIRAPTIHAPEVVVCAIHADLLPAPPTVITRIVMFGLLRTHVLVAVRSRTFEYVALVVRHPAHALVAYTPQRVLSYVCILYLHMPSLFFD